MGLWSGGCDEEKTDYYWEKFKSKQPVKQNLISRTQITNKDLQIGNINFENLELIKQNKILIADKENILNELKFIINNLQPNKNYKGGSIIDELQNVITTYNS